MKTILFRADSSSVIGTGHIMRDLVLAKQYVGSKIIFATQDLEGNLNSKILESGYIVENLNSNNLDELNILVKNLSIDMLVIDHYGIDNVFEQAFKESNPMMKILSFDDMYEKHHCDILLNHNIYADKSRYVGLVPHQCELRCGKEFTLLRDEFHLAKEERKVLTNGSKQVFLAMGGSDSANWNISILEVLCSFPDLYIHVVTTTANKYIGALKRYITNHSNITLHINSNSLANIMQKCDFAIVTPSVTLNEVFFMELPFIAIQTAPNQLEMVSFLRKNDFIILDTFNKKLFENAIYKLLDHDSISLVNFIDLEYNEKLMILEWRNNPLIREWMFSKEVISQKNHFIYIDTLKEKSDRAYFLVKQDSRAIGVIDFTDIAIDQANIGLYSNPNLRGMGSDLMRAIIEYGFFTLNVKKLISEVFEENFKAIRLYQKFGFIKKDKKDKIIIMELKNENR